jgi:acetate kinase
MDWCGVRLDPVRNEAAVEIAPGQTIKISEEGAPLACYVAGVDEEVVIARATLDCVLNRSSS